MAPQLRKRSVAQPQTPYARPASPQIRTPTRRTAASSRKVLRQSSSAPDSPEHTGGTSDIRPFPETPTRGTIESEKKPRKRKAKLAADAVDLDSANLVPESRQQFSESTVSEASDGNNMGSNDSSSSSSSFVAPATPVSSGLFSSFFKVLATPAQSALSMLGVLPRSSKLSNVIHLDDGEEEKDDDIRPRETPPILEQESHSHADELHHTKSNQNLNERNISPLNSRGSSPNHVSSGKTKLSVDKVIDLTEDNELKTANESLSKKRSDATLHPGEKSTASFGLGEASTPMFKSNSSSNSASPFSFNKFIPSSNVSPIKATEFKSLTNSSFSFVDTTAPTSIANSTNSAETLDKGKAKIQSPSNKYDAVIAFLSEKGDAPLTKEEALRLNVLIQSSTKDQSNIPSQNTNDPFRNSVALDLSDLAPEENSDVPPIKINPLAQAAPLFTFGRSSTATSSSLFGRSKPLFAPVFTFSAQTASQASSQHDNSIIPVNVPQSPVHLPPVRGRRTFRPPGNYVGASFGGNLQNRKLATPSSSSRVSSLGLPTTTSALFQVAPVGDQSAPAEPTPKRQRYDQEISENVGYNGKKRRGNTSGIDEEYGIEHSVEKDAASSGREDDSAAKLILETLDETSAPPTGMLFMNSSLPFDRPFDRPIPPPTVVRQYPKAPSSMNMNAKLRQVKAAIASTAKPKSALVNARISDLKGPVIAASGTPSRPSDKNTGSLKATTVPTAVLSKAASFPVISRVPELGTTPSVSAAKVQTHMVASEPPKQPMLSFSAKFVDSDELTASSTTPTKSAISNSETPLSLYESTPTAKNIVSSAPADSISNAGFGFGIPINKAKKSVSEGPLTESKPLSITSTASKSENSSRELQSNHISGDAYKKRGSDSVTRSDKPEKEKSVWEEVEGLHEDQLPKFDFGPLPASNPNDQWLVDWSGLAESHPPLRLGIAIATKPIPS